MVVRIHPTPLDGVRSPMVRQGVRKDKLLYRLFSPVVVTVVINTDTSSA